MRTMQRLGAAVIGLMLSAGLPLAQTGSASARAGADAGHWGELVPSVSRGADAISGVRIVGFVWQPDDSPVVEPVLRLRDLRHGGVAARTRGSALGEFRFELPSGGMFLLELVDANDQVVAVGQPLAVAPGETVATFLRAHNNLSPPSTFGFAPTGGGTQRFGEAAPQVVSGAADAGVNAFGGGNAASNER